MLSVPTLFFICLCTLKKITLIQNFRAVGILDLISKTMIIVSKQCVLFKAVITSIFSVTTVCYS